MSIMADSIADDVMREQSQLAAIRAPWEAHWQECAQFVLPRQDEFFGARSPGGKRTEKMFDSTAPLALDRFTAAMEGMLVPRTQKWHRLRATDPALNKIPAVIAYFEEATEILFRSRYAPHSNFPNQINETFASLGALGTSAMFLDDMPGKGIYYKSLHLSEIFISEDHRGRVDKVHRKFRYSVRQAVKRWGLDQLPADMQQVYAAEPERKFDFIHCVRPNEERHPARADFKGMEYASYVIVCDSRSLVHGGGYRTMPMPVSRYRTSPREIYGRSPAMEALAAIKMINEMKKTMLRAAHKQVDPPMLIHDDNVISRLRLVPNGLNVGGVDSQGRQMIQPLQTNARLDYGLQMLEAEQRTINDTFLVSLFQILVQTPEMTATEVLERAKEKGWLLAPTMGRQQAELLGPIIERELDLLAANGVLPEMPPELVEARGDYAIEYDSPLNRAQRAEEAAGFFRTIEGLTPLAQLSPEFSKVLAEKFDADAVIDMLVDVNGVPQRLLLSEDKRRAKEQEEQDASELQGILAAAPVVAKTAKDMAAAGAAAGAALA
ncbi:MAG: phage head-tail adapter protein [Proteobacteria bacterium]|nr:MAG: phage head-tail adapter protein [Pseudomonadota bacterium]